MTHRLRELSHTADVGFEVRAPDLEGLFEGAARGLLDALGVEPAGGAGAGEDGGRSVESAESADPEPVRLSRPDLERLLVHWLRELLARSMAEGEVPEAEVLEVHPGGGAEDDAAGLRARVRWRRTSPDGPTREIKGVTYHGLRVAPDGDGWHARVVLDV